MGLSPREVAAQDMFASLDSLEGAPFAIEADVSAPARLWLKARRVAPGLLIAGLVALAASWLGDHYKAPVMLFALLLGVAVNFVGQEPSCRPGIDLASRQVLRIGVALLGARITVEQVLALGGETLVIAASAVVLTILVGWGLARVTGMRGAFGILTGGAVAICGASAALAIASVLPPSKDRERDTVLTVVGVTALSTIAMIVYPMIAALLHLSQVKAGVFLGATIHDVAQVVGAGYSVSKVTGDTATIVKLFRVAMLLPAAVAISLAFRRQASAGSPSRRPPLAPLFLIGFAVLVGINSTPLAPKGVMSFLADSSRWFLVTAIAGVGAKTVLGDLVRVGWRPVLLMILETVFVLIWVLGLQALT